MPGVDTSKPKTSAQIVTSTVSASDCMSRDWSPIIPLSLRHDPTRG
jgi:hypothetical protein